MYKVTATNRFPRYYKQCLKRKYDIRLLNHLIRSLEKSGTVPQKYNPHALTGNYKGYWNVILNLTGF